MKSGWIREGESVGCLEFKVNIGKVITCTQLAQFFCPRIICMGFTWELRGTWDMGNPTHKMRILCVGIPTVGLPMHIMRGFSHVKYAHFCPRIKCAFYAYVLYTFFPCMK